MGNNVIIGRLCSNNCCQQHRAMGQQSPCLQQLIVLQVSASPQQDRVTAIALLVFQGTAEQELWLLFVGHPTILIARCVPGFCPLWESFVFLFSSCSNFGTCVSFNIWDEHLPCEGLENGMTQLHYTGCAGLCSVLCGEQTGTILWLSKLS